MSDNNASEGVAGGVDMKFIMQALTSEVKYILRRLNGTLFEGGIVGYVPKVPH